MLSPPAFDSDKVKCLKSDFESIIEIYSSGQITQSDLKDISLELENIKYQADTVFNEVYFTGEHDKDHCFLEIIAGTGGMDAKSCVEILYNMYVKWAIKKGVKFNTVSINKVPEGMRSCIMEFNFEYAFGFLSFERGAHRIVRISPFNSNGKRQTSFVNVYVYYKASKTKLQIDSKDIKIFTCKASGAGGQHVNTTDSAVRIKHIPTGIMVSCQNERSQHRNKSTAMSVLISKLEKIKEDDNNRGDNIMATWGGAQVRSYIFNPYRKIKDHRSGLEINNIDSIVKYGDLDIILLSRFNNSKSKL